MEERCRAPVVPLHVLLRLGCIQQGTSGLPPRPAQVVNEVPDYCVLCAKMQEAEKLFSPPFLLSQASSYGERKWGSSKEDRCLK